MFSNAGRQRAPARNSDFTFPAVRLCTGSAASTSFLAEASARVSQRGGPSWQTQPLRLDNANRSDLLSLGLMRWLPGLDQADLAGIHMRMIAYQLRQSLDPVERFGLSRAEARVARGLIAGLSPKAIALQQGRSLSTIRNHMTQMMVKTSTNRQFDLVLTLTHIAEEYFR